MYFLLKEKLHFHNLKFHRIFDIKENVMFLVVSNTLCKSDCTFFYYFTYKIEFCCATDSLSAFYTDDKSIAEYPCHVRTSLVFASKKSSTISARKKEGIGKIFPICFYLRE